MPSKQEILDQIAALQTEADNMGDDDDFEVEIWNEKGEGARLPHSRSRPWLESRFPGLFPSDDVEGSDDKTGTNAPDTGKAKGDTSKPVRTSTPTKYFGKRPAGK